MSAEKFAWSAYQSAPDPSLIPRPSQDLIDRVNLKREFKWLPGTLPHVPLSSANGMQQQSSAALVGIVSSAANISSNNKEEDSSTQVLTSNLLKMLGVS